MNSRSGLNKVFSLLLAFALMIAYVIPVDAAGDADAQGAAWYDSINEMLAAGKYEEGVVIAGIDMSRAKKKDNPGSALKSKKLKGVTEELISVDPENALTDEELNSWLREHKGKFAGQNEGICITSIRRSDMTTAKILKLLASDDSIVFAEPNYIVSMESRDGEADVSGEASASDAPDAAVTDLDNDNNEDAVNAVSGELTADPANNAEEESSDTVNPEQQNDETAGTNTDVEEDASGLEVYPGRSDAPALDAAKYQWSSSGDSTFRAFGQQGNTSMNVPGWPDGSNMDHEIVVAVIDQAVDFSNPDLKDRAFTFTPEQQKLLGCDEHGFNAAWESKDGKLEVFPGLDHATHVAGTIGASWDGKGVNGVGSDVRIVSVQIIRDTNKSSLIDSLRAMDFVLRANELGAGIRITNNSWGVYQDSKALDAAVTQLGKSGVITVFAASNDGHDITEKLNFVNTLTENPYAIIVGATDVSGNLADFSNFGNGVVMLAAPGTDILSCGKMNYIPFMANENKYYENFENDSTQLKIYQVDYETGEKVEGTDGQIKDADKTMGFEGSRVFEVPAVREHADEEVGYARFQLDFSDVEGLNIDTTDDNTDYVGFAYGGVDEIELDEISGYRDWIYTYSHDNSWNINNGPLNEMEISPGPVITLTMDISFVDKVYFDAVGIGSERHPYTIKSGTSMACPAVAGAAAVIASRHYDELKEMNSAASAERLAALVRGSVRPLPSLFGKVSTGGIIDLSVDETASDPEEKPAPDITDVTVSGKKVTLTGRNFGSSAGKVTIRKYEAGKDSAEKKSEISAWSDDKAEVLLDDDFAGIAEAEIIASNGKRDTYVKFISKSSNVFEKDHPFNSETGDPILIDRPGAAQQELMGDMETTGMMVPLDGKIYYMPAATLVEANPAYKSLLCYDPEKQSWSACPDYPAWIAYASAAAYDGKLYVKGREAFIDDATGAVYYDYLDETEVCIYSYTPGDNGWKKCSADGVPNEYTLFSSGNRLLMAGATFDFVTWTEYDAVMEYDPEKGAGTILCKLPDAYDNPFIGCGDGCIILCRRDGKVGLMLNSDLSEENISIITFPLEEDDSYTFTGNDEMLILIGPVSADGTSETYVFDPGKKEFTPYVKRASDAAVLGPASVILNNELYVLGGSDFEPDKRVFRSTLLDVPEPDMKKCTITYDLNGGSYDGSTDNIIEEHAKDSVIVIHDAPEMDGYTFKYWKGSEYMPGDEYTVTEDHTFVAQWEKNDDPADGSPADSDGEEGGHGNAGGSGSSGGRVNTGDESHMGLWIILAVLAALEFAAMAIMRRRRSR